MAEWMAVEVITKNYIPCQARVADWQRFYQGVKDAQLKANP